MVVEDFFEEFYHEYSSSKTMPRDWVALYYVEMDRDLQIYIEFREFFNLLYSTVAEIFMNRLVSWREGDTITREHRLMLAKNHIVFADTGKEQEKKVHEKYLAMPETDVAAMLAVSIAIYKGMDAARFKQQFPIIASESNAPIVTNFLKPEPEPELEAEREWDGLLEN